MALPVTITGISTAVAPVGPFKTNGGLVASGDLSGANQQWGGGGLTNIGMSFTTGSGENSQVSLIKVALWKTGTPTDNVTIDIYAVDGSNLPTGPSLGTSNVVAGSSLGTTALGSLATSVSFTFATPVSLSASTAYCFILSRSGAVDAANNYNLKYGTNAYAGGGRIIYNAGWFYSATNDLIFGVYGATAYYFFGRDGTTATTLQAYKATDPAAAWASIATKTGFTTAINRVSACQSGNVIHMAVQDGTVSTSIATKYVSFDCATDTFLTTIETVAAAAAATGTIGTIIYDAALVVRSNGNVVFFYSGAQTKTSGTFYSRVYYRVRTGLNTYGTAVEVDANTAFNAGSPIAALGSSDRVHFTWIGNAVSTLSHRHLTSANVLGTASNANTSVTYNWDVSTRDNAGTITHFGSVGSAGYRWTSGDNPTLTTVATAFGGPTRLVDSNSILYALYTVGASAAVSIKSSSDDGATWGSATTAFTASANFTGSLDTNLSKNQLAYTRSGLTVFPYIVNDNGTWKYNEYQLPTLDAWNINDKNGSITLSNGDKSALVGNSSNIRSTQTRVSGTAGKYYFEFHHTNAGGTSGRVGLHNTAQSIINTTYSTYASEDGAISVLGISGTYTIPAITAGGVTCVAWDAGAETIWFRRGNGLWNNSGTADPATGVGGINNSGAANVAHALYLIGVSAGGTVTVRTELADLGYQGPAGFSTWMGEAIPIPSIADAWNANDKLTVTLSNNDKTATTTSSDAGVRSTQAQTSGTAGKYYAEFLIVGSNAGTYGYGIAPTSGALNSPIARFHVQASTGNIRINNTAVGPSLGAIAVDDVISVAWDAGARLVWFRKNSGLWNNTAGNDPATNVGGLDTSFAASTPHALWVGSTVNGAGITLRTETAEFTQGGPTGFLSWMGEALVVLPVEGTGTLAAQAATTVAPGVSSSSGTGALVAVDSTGQRGSGAATWNASGALVADVADLDAVGDVTWQPRTGTGALVADNTTGQRGAGVSQSVNTAQSLVAINSTGQRGAGVSGSINTLTALIAGVADLDAVGQVTSAPVIGTGALVSATAVLAGVGVMTNYAWVRPGSDVAADGWTDQAGGVSNIYTTLDEPYAANDTDYVKSPTGAGDLVVRLFEGSTQIATWSHVNPPDTFTTAEQTLTTPQYAAISDFSNLFVEFDDSQSNVYRFKLGATTFADPPVTLRYRYKKTA